jgi:hypothetical protein
MQYFGRNFPDQSSLMLANLTTLPNFSVSPAMSFPKSADDPAGRPRRCGTNPIHPERGTSILDPPLFTLMRPNGYTLDRQRSARRRPVARSPDAYSISSIQQADENPGEHHDSDIDHKDKQEKRAKSQVV